MAMESPVIVKLADNIISPLGYTTNENYQQVLQMHSAIRTYDGWHHIPQPFSASLFDWNELNQYVFSKITNREYSRFERLAILSITEALQQTDINPSSPDTLLIISTTKGNVELLDSHLAQQYSKSSVELGVTAERIAHHFNNPNIPITVCNACISGLHAQLLAQRMLSLGLYKYIIVCGCDVQSPFIVSGFQSFKALDPDPCRPFDCDRKGLNLGEAAATVIYGRETRLDEGKSHWIALGGAICNDANHISGPSRTAEGSYRALTVAIEKLRGNKLSMISVHGTATLYNDEMESIALERAAIQQIPVVAFKGYYGHTMGAAGVLETLLTMYATQDGMVPATRGYHQCGTTRAVNVCNQHRPSSGNAFIKLLSGFGGCNAAMAFKLTTPAL